MTTFLVSRQPAVGLPQPGETKSQYVPHVVRLPSGDLWLYVKGDESCAIHAHRSTDGGASFQWQGVAIAPTPGAWDSYYVTDPVVVADVAHGLLHLYYKGNDTPGYGGMAIGHATAPLSDPLTVTKAPEPILTAATAQAALGLSELRDFYLSDCVLDPWGVHTWFGGYYGSPNTPYRILRFRGAGFSGPLEIQGGQFSPEAPYDFVQCPSVFRDGDRYVMLFTEGYDGSHEDYRFVSAATCLADGNWAWQRTGVTVLDKGPAGGWDDRKAFAAHLLKTGARFDTPAIVDGQWHLYYSGGSMAEPNKARSGLARLTPCTLVTI